MLDALFPLTTFELEHPDFDSLDIQAEMDRYMQRQKAISACFEGTQHPDVVLDMLEAHSIDPVEYVAEVEQAIEFLIANSIQVDP